MRRYRKLRGKGKRSLSQAALARLVGLTDQAISQIERGVNTPRRENVRAIDEALQAGGEIVAAFGYDGSVSQLDVSRWVPLERHVQLAAKVDELIERVQELDADVKRLKRAGRQGAQ